MMKGREESLNKNLRERKEMSGRREEEGELT
jgi:hypothetical protein